MNVAFKKGKVDQKYLIAFFILLGFGLVMQYSASSSLGKPALTIRLLCSWTVCSDCVGYGCWSYLYFYQLSDS